MMRRAHRFPSTRHSVVRAIGSADPPERARAYDALARSYWRPVYAYIRERSRVSADEARDLTQEFFARDLEKAYLARFDPAKARFRTFVRICLDAFLANERQAAARLKRGGGVTLQPLDARDGTPTFDPPSTDPDPEAWLHREWIRELFTDAVEALRARCEAERRATALAIFTRYDLETADGAERPTYAQVAREHGIAVSDVTNQLAWARRAFREIVLASLRAVCIADAEFRAEARDLLGIDPS